MRWEAGPAEAVAYDEAGSGGEAAEGGRAAENKKVKARLIVILRRERVIIARCTVRLVGRLIFKQTRGARAGATEVRSRRLRQFIRDSLAAPPCLT